jgi:hypothetical protein
MASYEGNHKNAEKEIYLLSIPVDINFKKT